MKQTLTIKSFIVVASLLSFFAFAFVNFHSNTAEANALPKVAFSQSKVEGEEDRESHGIAVPDVTVLGRLWEISQRLLQHAN